MIGEGRWMPQANRTSEESADPALSSCMPGSAVVDLGLKSPAAVAEPGWRPGRCSVGWVQLPGTAGRIGQTLLSAAAFVGSVNLRRLMRGPGR